MRKKENEKGEEVVLRVEQEKEVKKEENRQSLMHVFITTIQNFLHIWKFKKNHLFENDNNYLR